MRHLLVFADRDDAEAVAETWVSEFPHGDRPSQVVQGDARRRGRRRGRAVARRGRGPRRRHREERPAGVDALAEEHDGWRETGDGSAGCRSQCRHSSNRARSVRILSRCPLRREWLLSAGAFCGQGVLVGAGVVVAELRQQPRPGDHRADAQQAARAEREAGAARPAPSAPPGRCRSSGRWRRTAARCRPAAAELVGDGLVPHGHPEDAADHVGRPGQGQAGEDAPRRSASTDASATAAPHSDRRDDHAEAVPVNMRGPAGGERGDQRADGAGRDRAGRAPPARRSSSARNGNSAVEIAKTIAAMSTR